MKEKENYFWATDMILVENLRLDTIRLVVEKMLKKQYFYKAFSKVGTIESIFPGFLFEDL